MKKLILFSCISFLNFHQAQTGNIGINTSNPEATLDINGNMILRKADLTNELDYNKIMVKSSSKGTADYLPLSSFKSNVINAKSEGKFIDLELSNEEILQNSVLHLDCLEVRFEKTSLGSGNLQVRNICNASTMTKRTRYWSTLSALGYFNFNSFSADKDIWYTIELQNYNVSVTSNIHLGVFNDNGDTNLYNIILVSNGNPGKMMISVEEF